MWIIRKNSKQPGANQIRSVDLALPEHHHDLTVGKHVPAGFTMEAYVIPPEGENEIEVNWEWLYGKLEPGTYRISKSIIDHRSYGNTNYTLSTQFYLAESQ